MFCDFLNISVEVKLKGWSWNFLEAYFQDLGKPVAEEVRSDLLLLFYDCIVGKVKFISLPIKSFVINIEGVFKLPFPILSAKIKKNGCSQPKLLCQEIFNMKKVLVGWN